MTFKKLISCLLSLILLLPVSTYTPQILKINHRIQQLQARNRQISALRNKSASQSVSLAHTRSAQLSKYSTSQVKFSSKCNVTGLSLSAFLFQTVTNVYFAINDPQKIQIKFFNHKCQQISMVDGVQISEVLCDRGVCQSGSLYFLSQSKNLYSASEDRNFSTVSQLANLQGANIVGGVIRNRGKDKIQIYLPSEDGIVRVFDESGVAKLRIQLEGFNTRIRTVRDHHPYPLIVMQSNWISMLDTTKYTEIAPNCPHIPDIRYVLAENYYGEAAYVITSNRIYLLDFEIGKKNCIIKREYGLQAELPSADSVSFFSNTIFIDNRVYNLTEKKMYLLDDACLSASLHFLYKKSQGEEIFAVKKCCVHQQCKIQFFQIKKVNEDRSILFWLTIAFIAVLFLSISFMKKSSINNLDLEDPSKLRQRQIQQQIMALANQAKSKQKKSSLKQQQHQKKQN